MSAIEKPIKSTLNRARKNNESKVYEDPKILFTVVINNNRQQKKEPEEKIKQEIDEGTTLPLIGLPPQPKEYLKYPDYDFF